MAEVQDTVAGEISRRGLPVDLNAGRIVQATMVVSTLNRIAVPAAGGRVITTDRSGLGANTDVHASEAGVSAHLIDGVIINDGLAELDADVEHAVPVEAWTV